MGIRLKRVWWKFYSEQEKESGISGMFFVILLASFAMVLINYSRPLVQKKVMISGELRNDLDTYTCYADQGIGIILKRPNRNMLNLGHENYHKLMFKDYFYNYKSYMNIIDHNQILEKLD